MFSSNQAYKNIQNYVGRMRQWVWYVQKIYKKCPFLQFKPDMKQEPGLYSQLVDALVEIKLHRTSRWELAQSDCRKKTIIWRKYCTIRGRLRTTTTKNMPFSLMPSSSSTSLSVHSGTWIVLRNSPIISNKSRVHTASLPNGRRQSL